MFRANNDVTTDFSHAQGQLAHWRAWFAADANRLKFIDEYGVPEYFRRRMSMSLSLVLVYGMRAEWSHDQAKSILRSSLPRGSDEELMSFDRLRPDRELSNAVTVKATGGGRFSVLHVPPTFTTGPAFAEDFLALDGLSDAIERNAFIPNERKQFLKTRVTYWQNWARQPGDKGIIEGGIRE